MIQAVAHLPGHLLPRRLPHIELPQPSVLFWRPLDTFRVLLGRQAIVLLDFAPQRRPAWRFAPENVSSFLSGLLATNSRNVGASTYVD